MKIFILIIVVLATQFILAGKQLEYGFYNDDWYVLGWYKQVVNDPLLDISKAWREIGPHNFVHAYYMGILYEIFKQNFFYYHIVNTLLKTLAVLSFFPVVYFLFKDRFLAFLATILLAFHFSPFGVIFHVIGGEGSLVVIFMNLFLAVYIYASQKNSLNNIKTMLILLGLLLATAFFEVTRAYPALLLLPFLELLNFWFGKSKRSFKTTILRLLFFYSPFIALIIYHPSALNEINFNKFVRTIDWGNWQLFLTIFSSFGSTFVPEGLMEKLTLFGKVGQEPISQAFRFLIVAIPALVITRALIGLKFSWILRSLFLTICFSVTAFFVANHWLYIDLQLRAPVDPGTYLIQALIGLFVLATAASFLISWLEDRKNFLLLTLFLAPFFALLYTFLTWILTDDNAIFMGVHAYLNIPTIGSSLYLAIILYLAFQSLRSKYGVFRKIAAVSTIIYFFLFFIFSVQQIDKFFSYWLKMGFAASEQQRLHNSFWQEVGLGKSKTSDPILIYLDGSQDKDNEYFYANSIVWDIPAMLTVEKGQPFDPAGYCKSVVSYKDIDKLSAETINNTNVIVQNTCGYDIFYKPENFFAFRMMNRDLIPIKDEILKQLGFE